MCVTGLYLHQSVTTSNVYGAIGLCSEFKKKKKSNMEEESERER